MEHINDDEIQENDQQSCARIPNEMENDQRGKWAQNNVQCDLGLIKICANIMLTIYMYEICAREKVKIKYNSMLSETL